MRRIMVKLLLVMTLTVPIFAQAQDVTEVPPPTFEAFETPTELPTAVPTETVTPDPTATPAPTATAIPVPPPLDQTKVFESVFSVVMALVVGAVAIGLTGIVGLLLLLSPPVRAILLGGVKVGIDEAGKIADKTETKVDDMAVEELRKLYIEMEKRLRIAENKVEVNTENIAVQAQQISNR